MPETTNISCDGYVAEQILRYFVDDGKGGEVVLNKYQARLIVNELDRLRTEIWDVKEMPR